MQKILILLVSLLIFSCSKKENHNIKGTIVNSCDDPTPVTYTEIRLYFLEKSSGVGIGGRSFEYTTTTDASGQFEFQFREKEWDNESLGTYGAELIVAGSVKLQGILPCDQNLREIEANYRRTAMVYSRVSTSGMDVNDSLFINQEFFGRGNLSSVADTLEADLIHENLEESYVPAVDHIRSGRIYWYVKKADGTRINGRETFKLPYDCISETSHDFVIEV